MKCKDEYLYTYSGDGTICNGWHSLSFLECRQKCINNELPNGGCVNPANKCAHAVWSDNGLITVSGGKLTTFRLIALDALAAARDNLPAAKEITDDRVFLTPKVSAETLSPKNISWAQRLLGRYGEKAIELLNESSKEEHDNLDATEFSLAECRWAIKYEAVEHLDDLMLRRTRLGMCLQNGGSTRLLP